MDRLSQLHDATCGPGLHTKKIVSCQPLLTTQRLFSKRVVSVYPVVINLLCAYRFCNVGNVTKWIDKSILLYLDYYLIMIAF